MGYKMIFIGILLCHLKNWKRVKGEIMKRKYVWLIAVAMLAVFISCLDREKPTEVGLDKESQIGRPVFSRGGSCLDTCDTDTCITRWVNSYGKKCTLYVASGTYSFSEEHTFDNGAFSMIGLSPFFPPELEYSVGDLGEKHAVFWPQEVSGSAETRIENLILDFYGVPVGKYAVEFEANNPVWKHIELKGSATSRFYFASAFYVNDLTLHSAHTLQTDPGYASGSKIVNSDLQGKVKIDETTAVSGKTIYFRNNEIHNLELDADQANTVKLAENEFKASGASVKMIDNFTVQADSNVTLKGRCECDADDDFNITGSATLVLNSWIYQGTLYPPEINNLSANRVGNTVTVTWNTDCVSSSKVIWGYSAGSLTNTATGSAGTSHNVQFTVQGTEGCVYYRAISQTSGCSGTEDADTSSTQVNVKDIVIYDVDWSFNAFLCEVTVTWMTNVKSSSKVYWGSSCSSLPNIETGANNVTSHTVVIDVTGAGKKIGFKVESANSCDSAQSSCETATSGPCFPPPR